ncbi:hypothetical protein FRC03_001466 [Tulasnella sp. 419]|nr:hypothetical protein FRC03_001466 [Tulasnella sp. 419]
MFSLSELCEWVYLILLVLVIVGSQVAEISDYLVTIIKAMTISKGIYIQTCVTAKNICSSLSAAVDSWAAKKAEPVCTSPVALIQELETVPTTPKVRRVRFCNDNVHPFGATQWMHQSTSSMERRVAETRTPPTRPALRPAQNVAVPVRDKPPTRRVTFSKWKHMQEYDPRAPPEHTQSSGLRAGFGSTSRDIKFQILRWFFPLLSSTLFPTLFLVTSIKAE